MKTNLFTLLFATITLLFSSELKAQGPDGPCALPTYSVLHNIDDGIVIFDIYQALLLNNQINLATEQGPCQVWIDIEANNCFYDQTSYNDEYIAGGLCGLVSWDLLLTDTDDDCCGSHTIPYYVQFEGADGAIFYCIGFINIDIECGTECGIIDFTQVLEDDTSSAECIKVCENSNTLAIAPTYSNSGYNYTWVVQGGDVVEGQGENEATISWGDFGTGNIEVIITNSNQNLPPISLQYCIEILEGPEAMFTTPGYACLETPMYFDGSTSNILSNVNITDFQWDFGDNESGQGETVSHDYDNPGTYTVTLTVYSEIKDDQGNVICICADVYQEDVLVDDLVGPNIYWVSTLCEGDASSYWTDDVCGTYTWSVYDANGTPITSPDFTGQGNSEIFVTWGQGPHGTIELVVTGCNPVHCTDPTSVQVPIIPATDEISGPDVVCVGDVATYSLTKWNSVDYDWSVTGGGTIINTPNSAENTITIQWNTSGSIHVDYSSEFLQCLPNHSANDCMGLADLNVEVKDEWFLSHNSTSTTVCLDDVTTFTAYSINTPLNQLTSYWSVDAGANTAAWGTNTVYGLNYDVTWTVPGPVVVSVTKIGPHPFCNETIEYYFNVVDVPQPTAIYGPGEVCAQSPEYIYEVDPSSGLNVVWSATAGTGTPIVNPTQGSYTQVSWNQSAQFTIYASYEMSSAPYCASTPISRDVDELIIEPANITGDPACANSSGIYNISPTHADATISWSISPAQYGSILSGLGTNDIVVQWNNITGNTQTVTITAVVELCDNSSTFNEGYIITRAIEPTVLSNDFCEGDEGTVYVDNASDFVSFQWTPGTGVNGNVNFDYEVTNAGEYIVNTVDNNLCPSSGGTTIDLLPAPILNLTTLGPTTLCNGTPNSTEIVAPDNPNYYHSWTVNGVLQSNIDPTITHNWIGNPLPETYQYVVTVFDGTCYSSETKVISEITNCPPPPPCNPENFNLSPFVTNNNPCDEFSFDYTSSNNFTFTGWNFGDGGTSNSPTPIHSYNEIGYYNVSVLGQVPSTNNMGDCNVAEVITIAVQMVAQMGIDVSCTPSNALPQVCIVDQSAYLPGTTYIPTINIDGSISTVVMGGQYCNGSMSPGALIGGELSAIHSSGCNASTTVPITIPGPVTIDPLNSACINEEIAFTASCPGAVSFEWNFDDTSTGATNDASLVVNPTAPAPHAYAEDGFYSIIPYTPNVTVTATHANGCEFTNNLTITINDNPQNLEIISTDGDFKYCIGYDEELSLSGTAGGYVTWWEGNSSNPPVGAGAIYHANTSGLYGAIITDLTTGCFIVLEPVQVDPWPDVPSGILGPSTLCEGDCTELIAPSGNYSYEWGNLNNSITSSTSSLNLCSYDIPNGDTFSLIITDGISDCISTSSITIDVEPTPIIQASTYPTLPCEGQPIALLVDPDLPNMSYIWTGGNANPYTVLNAGTYTVIGTNTDTGCKGTATVEVFPCPSLCEVPSGCYTACKPGKTICAGSEALETYQWNFDPDGNGYSPIPGETDPCFTATQDGMYTLTATNIYGCPKTSNLLDLEFIDCDSCQFAYADMLDLQLQSLGTSLYSTDIDGDGIFEDVSCCIWAIDPIISTANGADESLLCMDIFWGDNIVEYNVPFGPPIEHCYTEGCSDYTITVKIKCCDGSNSHGYTATAFCECVPDCYIRNAFWESFSPNPGLNTCEVCFTGTQFLGPDMQNHQNPSYSIIGIGNSVNITESGQYNICVDLEPGNYNVCRTVEGVSDVNELCESVHCHDIEVVCCDSTTIDPCILPENIVFYPTEDATGTCEDGCEWHFCLGGGGIDFQFDASHCFEWDFDDGTSYSSNTLQCASHCFDQSGTYNVCLTVYCCDDPSQSQSVQYCEIIEVNCGAPCELSAVAIDAEQMFFSADSCCFGVCPVLTPWSDVDPMSLCIDIDWGDDSAPLLGQMFAMCYDHCYGANGTYTITVTVYCCDDPASVFVFTETVSCGGCELPADLVFYPDGGYAAGAFCLDGECEWNFCLGIDFDFSSLNDSHCFTWDYGDGTIQTSNTPQCGVHCYPSGTYNVCFTIYCCDDPNQYVEYCETIVVNCGNECEFNPAIFDVDFDWGTNSNCPNGCDEVWFCATNYTLDSNYCIGWDFGDGNGYYPPLPECPIHCYNSPGVYNACLTVYCCEEGPDGPSAYTICHEVVVSCGGGIGGCTDAVACNYDPNATYDDGSCEYCSCGAIQCDCFIDCPEFEAGLGLVNLGTSTDAAGASCCEFGLVPTLLSDTCQIDMFDLCINVNWGDGSAPLLNASFPYGYTHCFPSSGSYIVTMEVYCCDADGETSQVWTFTDSVTCTGGGCDLPAIDFEWGRNGACANTGCDEMWFCLVDYPDYPNLCLSWDFGDGNIYNPSLPDCPIHCYNSAGVYSVCLTVYCCDEGPDGSSAYTVCHDVVVSCGCAADCPDFNAGLGLISLGTGTDASGASCCEYGLLPTLLTDSCEIDLFDLCINVDWGDGSPPLQNASFPNGYTHCFPIGGTYTVTMDVYCCADGAESQTWTFTDTVNCTGSGCELPADLVFYPSGSNQSGGAFCPDGECEWNFCLGIDFDFSSLNDSHCFTWDYGDGTIQTSNTPECGVHCYPSGTYNVCFTVYCCDDPTQYVEYCETIVVNCDGGGVPCVFGPEDFAPIEIIAFDDSPNGVCCFGICPMLMPWSDADLMSLCIDIDWGDDSAPLLGQMFAMCYDHCYGANGTYTITVTVYCCDDPASGFVFTETVSCGGCEIPEIGFQFETSTNSPNCTNGCEVQFCHDIYTPDENICLQWDFGDGNFYYPPQLYPECPVHCYSASGTYNACLSVYCCEGLSEIYTTCQTVDVSCWQSPIEACPGDFDLDGFIGVIDLLELLGAYGAPCE